MEQWTLTLVKEGEVIARGSRTHCLQVAVSRKLTYRAGPIIRLANAVRLEKTVIDSTLETAYGSVEAS